MYKKLTGKFNNKKGQAVVELAIVLPLLILILCGIIDYGWIFTNQNEVDNCAREGARYAIIHATDPDAATSIVNYTKSLATLNTASSLIVTVTFTNTDNPEMGDVTVAVSNQIQPLTPIAGIFTKGQKINLKSSCTMKVE